MTDIVYSDFTAFGTFGKRCALATIFLSSDTDGILSIYEDLLKGVSVRETFKIHGVNVLKMRYDVRCS